MTDDELKELLGDVPRLKKELQPESAETPAAQPESTEPLPSAVPDAPPAEPKAEIPPQPIAPDVPTADPSPFQEPAPFDPFAAAMPHDPFGGQPPQPPSDDPFAATYAAAAAPKPRRHILLSVLLFLLIAVLIAFAVLCIVLDTRKGTASTGGYRAGDVIEVNLVQHDRPEGLPEDTDENGRYTVAGIAKHVMPSIVEIYTYSDGKMNGSGSGIILSEDGFIATNAHVVSDASGYTVHLFDDEQEQNTSGYEATLIGHDSKTDLAILKISAHGLKPAALGNSDEVQLGETVCALGNPAGLSGSITTGIISGMDRKVRAQSTNFEMDCFQTDAAISPGNSGGALVDLYGNVIGITSSKYSSGLFTGTQYEGLGFAITINEAMPILTELMEQGYVSGRVRIGIQFLSNSDAHNELEEDGKKLPKELDGHGILVMAIADDSDLKNTIMKDGDWILTMNGKNVTDYDSVNEAIAGCVGGDSVHCRCGHVEESGKLKTYEIDFRLLEDQSGDY